MKRYLLLLIAVLLLLAMFVACGTDSDTSTNESTDGQNTEESTSDPTGTTLDTPSTERFAELEALIAKNKDRAFTIGESTIDKYSRVSVIVSRYYNPYSKRADGTASVWHYTAYYAMVSRLVDIAEDNSATEKEYNDISDKVYDGFKFYQGTGDIITYLGTVNTTLYGVNRSNSMGNANIEGDQMVYDDQMWIIREMVYRYKQTGDQQYLDEAIRLSNICIKGWDYTLDEDGNEYGGIPWGPYYSNKHTCSNAPIIAPLVEIYEILKEQEDNSADYYLTWAEKIYSYVKMNLRGANKCYDDSIGYTRSQVTGSNGKLKYVTTGLAGYDGKQYSYNTGAMISGGVALYRATGRSSFLTETKQTAIAAYNIFCKKSNNVPFYPNDSETTWFNLVLFQGFLDYYEYDKATGEKLIKSFQTSLDYAYDNYLKDGMLPRNFVTGWDKNSKFDTTNCNVMDQASYAQTYAMLAMWAEQVLAEEQAKLSSFN